MNLREHFYGKSSEQFSSDAALYHENKIETEVLTDLGLSCQFGRAWTVSLRASKLLGAYPDEVYPLVLTQQRANLDNGAVTIYPAFSPCGIKDAITMHAPA